MKNLRENLAETIVEEGDFTLDDFTNCHDLPDRRHFSPELEEAVLIRVKNLDPKSAAVVIRQHVTGDILLTAPNRLQSKYGINGTSALEFLACASLIAAIFDLLIEDHSEFEDAGFEELWELARLNHASRI